MIDYRGFNNLTSFGWDGDASLDDLCTMFDANELAKAYYVLDFLNGRLEKVKKKQEDIDDMLYEKGLLERDVISIVREDLAQSRFNIFRMMTPSDMLWHAWRYFHSVRTGKLDELRESCSEKGDFESYESAFNVSDSVVRNNLIPESIKDDVTLIGLYDYNYSEFYEFEYELVRDGKKVEFTISVPMFQSANENNYRNLILGYKLNYPEGKCTTRIAFSEIDPTKFKERMGEWVKKRLEGNEDGE